MKKYKKQSNNNIIKFIIILLILILLVGFLAYFSDGFVNWTFIHLTPEEQVSDFPISLSLSDFYKSIYDEDSGFSSDYHFYYKQYNKAFNRDDLFRLSIDVDIPSLDFNETQDVIINNNNYAYYFNTTIGICIEILSNKCFNANPGEVSLSNYFISSEDKSLILIYYLSGMNKPIPSDLTCVIYIRE